jgi:hypothetical protein
MQEADLYGAFQSSQQITTISIPVLKNGLMLDRWMALSVVTNARATKLFIDGALAAETSLSSMCTIPSSFHVDWPASIAGAYLLSIDEAYLWDRKLEEGAIATILYNAQPSWSHHLSPYATGPGADGYDLASNLLQTGSMHTFVRKSDAPIQDTATLEVSAAFERASAHAAANAADLALLTPMLGVADGHRYPYLVNATHSRAHLEPAVIRDEHEHQLASAPLKLSLAFTSVLHASVLHPDLCDKPPQSFEGSWLVLPLCARCDTCNVSLAADGWGFHVTALPKHGRFFPLFVDAAESSFYRGTALEEGAVTPATWTTGHEAVLEALAVYVPRDPTAPLRDHLQVSLVHKEAGHSAGSRDIQLSEFDPTFRTQMLEPYRKCTAAGMALCGEGSASAEALDLRSDFVQLSLHIWTVENAPNHMVVYIPDLMEVRVTTSGQLEATVIEQGRHVLTGPCQACKLNDGHWHQLTLQINNSAHHFSILLDEHLVMKQQLNGPLHMQQSSSITVTSGTGESCIDTVQLWQRPPTQQVSRALSLQGEVDGLLLQEGFDGHAAAGSGLMHFMASHLLAVEGPCTYSQRDVCKIHGMARSSVLDLQLLTDDVAGEKFIITALPAKGKLLVQQEHDSDSLDSIWYL